MDYAVACPDTMQMIRSLVVEQDGTLSDHYALRLQLDLPVQPASDQDSSSGCGALPRRMSGAAQLERWTAAISQSGAELASITWAARLAAGRSCPEARAFIAF